MASHPEASVCYQNRRDNCENGNDLFRNIHLNNPTDNDNIGVEQGFRNLDSTFRGKIRSATILVQEKCSLKNGNILTHASKNLLNILLMVSLIVLFILAISCYTLGNGTYDRKRKAMESVKCKICGPGVKWHTMLGDVFGNMCGGDSDNLEEMDHDCGPESACFTMTVTQSPAMNEYLVLPY